MTSEVGPSLVDKLRIEQAALLEFLAAHNELSFLASVEDMQRKTLLLGIASFFEHTIQEMLLRFVHARSAGDEAVVAMLKKKAIDRQYHTYFDWRGSNANSFFGLFGQTISDRCKKAVKESTDLDKSVRAFLELGNLRNELVHINFLTYPLEKTAEEIYALYKVAAPFLVWLETIIFPHE